MVKVCAVPLQPFAFGVTVMVATAAVAPVLTAANDAMLPLPDPARPMLVLLFVQLNVVPLVLPVNVTAVVFAPLQSVWLPGATTLGDGLTVIVNVWAVPPHPFAEGVTVMVAVTGPEPLLEALNAAILPVPEAARPMEGVLLVQL